MIFDVFDCEVVLMCVFDAIVVFGIDDYIVFVEYLEILGYWCSVLCLS